jgi:hypothetical protein
MLATEFFSIAGAASAANSSRSDGSFAAKAAPFTVVQIKTTKQAFASVPLWHNLYRINPLSLVKTLD